MKRIKMLLYGEPGVGKSVFALKAPKPFFVCTDGNYEWLEEFGADPNAHRNVSSWAEMKEVLESNFDGYETVVVDLLEDGFKWCEMEYCVRNKIEHVSDVSYGKAYDTTRNEFFITISKLLSIDKHVILICHGITFTKTDRRGVEHTCYAPSSRLPDKVLDMIEGRVRYCLRCYTATYEEKDGKITKQRYLSLVPKENEYGIIRGVDENLIPHDIPLDFNEFAKAIKLNVNVSTTQTKQETSTHVNQSTENVQQPSSSNDVKAKLAALKLKKNASEDVKPQSMTNTKNVVEDVHTEPTSVVEVVSESDSNSSSDSQQTSENNEVKVNENAPFTDVASTSVTETTVTPTNDKLAAIKAKLAAMKAAK